MIIIGKQRRGGLLAVILEIYIPLNLKQVVVPNLFLDLMLKYWMIIIKK